MKNILKNVGLKCTRVAANMIMHRRLLQRIKESEKELKLFLPSVYQTLQSQKEEGGFFSEIYYIKLIELFYQLEKRKPTTIVELGSGATSAVMIDYVSRNKGTTYVSVDESVEYLEKTKKRLFNKEFDVEKVRFLHCPRIVEIVDEQEVCRYEPVYLEYLNQTIDLLYVDGPSNLSEMDKNKHIPCIDSTYIMNRGVLVRNILFDFRISSVKYLADSKFAVLYDKSLHRGAISEEKDAWPVQDIMHHSIFTLKELAGVTQYYKQILK